VEISRREFQELQVQAGDAVYIKLVNPRVYRSKQRTAWRVISDQP